MLLSLSIPACGPGFPIMTGEQDKLVTDVDRVLKESEALKGRVERLEGGGGLAAVRGELEGLKRSLAEANMNLDKLRQDLAYVKGTVEEDAHEREKLREGIRAADSGSAAVNERLASIEYSVKSAQDRLASFEASQQDQSGRLSEVRDAVASLEKKAASLERAVSETRAGAAAKARGDRTAKPEDAEALYQRGYRETTSKDFPGAVDTFQKFLSSYPDHKYAGNAQYWLGEIYYAKGDWEMAVLEFDKAVKKYPGSEKTPASLLKQGFAFEKLGAGKEARVLLDEIVRKYPASPEADLAKKKLETLK